MKTLKQLKKELNFEKAKLEKDKIKEAKKTEVKKIKKEIMQMKLRKPIRMITETKNFLRPLGKGLVGMSKTLAKAADNLDKQQYKENADKKKKNTLDFNNTANIIE